ncbi:MAG: beta-ketoacyl-[acyl-carrier-protein] synthase II, partial [Mariprofundales bacterium]|nr:beta-ketoacyl-[acyl-carrier-protein] synthase II [Mariprofundales bacterium]
WDQGRDGFVMGEGAGVLLLESFTAARRRGAEMIAEVVGYGMSGDAHHITAPAPGGEGGARCMQAALRSARLGVESVDYINAHGTSTPAGDLAETEGIKRVFGARAGELMVTSNKSMIGHLLGAAGRVEAALTALSIARGVATPTINLEQAGAGCDLDYVANEARDAEIRVAISNSFGFGGTNASLVLRRL